MSRYYSGWGARHYNTHWNMYTERTLAAAMAMIDVAALRHVPERQGRPARALDVACGTGLLLKRLIEYVPDVEASGVDASADMLAQAHAALKDQPHVYLEQATINGGETANLPYAPQSFDLITCTNALHGMPDPVGTLRGLRTLLAVGGQLVLEDFARREPPFPWFVVEWLAEQGEGRPVHAFSLQEAQSLCLQAGLPATSAQTFHVNWLWQCWVLAAG